MQAFRCIQLKLGHLRAWRVPEMEALVRDCTTA